MMRLRSPLMILLVVFLGFAAERVGHAGVVYHVTVDTSPIAGQAGYLDLQFNPGSDSLPATVAIHNVVTDGTLGGSSTNTGDVTGTLPGSPDVHLSNTSGYNDLFQSLVFGNSFAFDAEFTGPALSPVGPLPFFGSVFALTLIDSDTVTPLLSTAFDGTILRIDVNPDGSTTVSSSLDSTGTLRATATLLGDSVAVSVPEPASLWAFGLGFLGLLGFRFARGLRGIGP